MPHSEITPLLRQLCVMQLTPLTELIEYNVVPVKGSNVDPVLWLDRLSAILRHISIHNVGTGKHYGSERRNA